MENLRLNHLAVLAAIVLQFVLGFLWYGPFFGNAWMELVGLDLATIEANPPGFSEWFTNIVTAVATIYLLAFLFTKLGIKSWLTGLLWGFLIGFVFVLLPEKTSGAFAGYPYALPWITGGFTTAGFALGGLVLGAWTKSK